MIIPDDERLAKYSGNLIGGLAMNVVGPHWARLALNVLVVGVGFLILSGAVNTSIIGSNGVLNRVAEDGVIPDWFLKPHPKYGTSYRMINLVVGLQLTTIVLSRGRVLTLGEAYAFGVIWSFVFNSLSMLVLRFKRPGHREYEVPINIKVRGYEFPVGIAFVFLVLSASAVVNFLTKEVATVSGVLFTGVFFTIFAISERRHIKRTGQGLEHHEHLEQFNQSSSAEVTAEGAGDRQAVPQACRDPVAAQPGDARPLSVRDRSRDDRRGRHDGAAHPPRQRRFHARGDRGGPRPADGRGQHGRARGQAGQAADRAHERADLRPDPHGTHDRGARAHHGGLEPVRPQRPARSGGPVLDQRLPRPRPALDDPGAEQGPRRPARHRRREPDSPRGRADG